MNYIDLLTQEEKPILCRIITGKDFKELFKRNEQEFSKIRKGFRAKSLTEQQALSIAIVNVDKPLIAMWVNTRVDIWLKEIQENIKELEEEGSTHDIALASTMLDSVFANNVDLYLKLAGKTMDADARSKLHERMESIKSERARNAEVADRSKVLEGEKHHLLDQIAAAQQSINTIKAEYERKIQELEQDKDTLELLSCRLLLPLLKVTMPIISHSLTILILLFCPLLVAMKSFLYVVLSQITMGRNGLFDMLI